MSKVLNKKIENLALEKKITYKLIFQFSKKKKKLSLQERQVKMHSIFSEIKSERIIKNRSLQETNPCHLQRNFLYKYTSTKHTFLTKT